MGDESAGLDDLNEAIARCSANGMLGQELRARNNVAWLLALDDPRRTLDAARRDTRSRARRRCRTGPRSLPPWRWWLSTLEWDWALAAIKTLEPTAMSQAHRIDIAATHTILRSLRGTPARGVR